MNMKNICHEVFSESLINIIQERNFSASKYNNDYESIQILQNDSLLNLGSPLIDKYVSLTFLSKNLQLESIKKILDKCTLELKRFCFYDKNRIPNCDKNIEFAMKDLKLNKLYIFKNINGGQLFLENGYFNIDLAKEFKVSAVEEIYLIFEKIESLIINYDYLIKTKSIIHIHALKWFFIQYFSEQDWSTFKTEYINFTKKMEEYIGMTITKNFSPFNLNKFKRTLKIKLLNYPYQNLLKENIKYDNKIYTLPKQDLNFIDSNYIQKELYYHLLSDEEYAKSFITAEWLFNSMKNAMAIDLTVIAMGYFKSFEQLLFKIIKQANNKFSEDKTIGEMVLYVKRNKNNLFYDSISPYGKNYFIQSLYKYKEMRNSYLHKNNIISFKKITDIQNATYNIIYMTLGSLIYTNVIFNSNNDTVNDFDKLGECIDFYKNRIFILYYKNQEYWVKRISSDFSIDNNKIIYNQIAFKNIVSKRIILMTKNFHPFQIFLGNLIVNYDGKLNFDITKSTLLFDKGKYMGPDIAEHIEFQY